mmetsp:Transcript_18485/g.24427  ORF Transcript_18485/g.24427 Transcript_18485/m.24427 type:complete len:108 (+) Transcript_18485:1399-1722(+)
MAKLLGLRINNYILPFQVRFIAEYLFDFLFIIFIFFNWNVKEKHTDADFLLLIMKIKLRGRKVTPVTIIVVVKHIDGCEDGQQQVKRYTAFNELKGDLEIEKKYGKC